MLLGVQSDAVIKRKGGLRWIFPLSCHATTKKELPTPASAERIVVVDFSRNFGKESALLAGLQHAEGDAVGLMDADLQQPPATLLEMYRMLQANPSADCVAAFQEHRNEGAVLSFFKHAFYKTFDATSRLNVMPDASDFRVFHRRVADALLSMPESFRFSKGRFPTRRQIALRAKPSGRSGN